MNQHVARIEDAIHRIVADLRTTTGDSVEFHYELGQEDDLRLQISIGSTYRGDFFHPVMDSEKLTGGLAFIIQSQLMDMLGDAWPKCPIHGRHPLTGSLRETADKEAVAVWQCPRDHSVFIKIGDYRDSKSHSEPAVPPGTVKWYFEEGGFGVVSSESGDAWFHFSSIIEQTNFRTIKEGDEVEFEIVPRKQGAFQFQAKSVRKRSREV